MGGRGGWEEGEGVRRREKGRGNTLASHRSGHIPCSDQPSPQ